MAKVWEGFVFQRLPSSGVSFFDRLYPPTWEFVRKAETQTQTRSPERHCCKIPGWFQHTPHPSSGSCLFLCCCGLCPAQHCHIRGLSPPAAP